MKKLLRSIALVLPMVLVSSNSYAAVKAGSSCTKAGIKSVSAGKTYTCVKSGKKLVWSKGVLVPVANPSPSSKAIPEPISSPSAKPTPSQTPVAPIDEVSSVIFQIRSELINNQSTSSQNLTFIFQGETSQEVEEKTKRSLQRAIPVFENLGFKTTDALILVARDIDWLKLQLDANECKYRSLPGRPGFYVGDTCKDGNGAVTSVHWEAEPFSDGLNGLYFNHVLPHEYFHQIQEQLTTFGNADFPKWFWEGSAQFFTNQAWSTWHPDRSYTDWFSHWWKDLRPDLGAQACKDSTIEKMADPSTAGVEGICAYSKGQLIVEYLIYKYGLTKYRLMYSQNSVAGWQNFGTVFKKVTGDDLREFYIGANTFILGRGW